jgi:hypothetical protein
VAGCAELGIGAQHDNRHSAPFTLSHTLIVTDNPLNHKDFDPKRVESDPEMGGNIMAGRGPQPKPAEKRAGHSKDTSVMRILPAILAQQPELPDFNVTSTYKDADGDLITETVPYVWAPLTYEWWRMWADSALAVDFTSTDWSELRDTALLHSEYWRGKFSLAGELRLRTAKFGATPEDRARLRITFAQASEAEVKTFATSSRDRFAGITVPAEVVGG